VVGGGGARTHARTRCQRHYAKPIGAATSATARRHASAALRRRFFSSSHLGASVNKQQGQNTCFSHHQAVGVAFQLRLLASIGILSVPDKARHGGLVD